MTKEGHSLRDFDNSVFVDPNGNKVPFYDEDKRKVISMFRELGFLFGDNLYHLWVVTEKHPRIRKRVLTSVEQELENLIDCSLPIPLRLEVSDASPTAASKQYVCQSIATTSKSALP